jgi:hypothetical protein
MATIVKYITINPARKKNAKVATTMLTSKQQLLAQALKRS